jgi:hypothetical protein
MKNSHVEVHIQIQMYMWAPKRFSIHKIRKQGLLDSLKNRIRRLGICSPCTVTRYYPLYSLIQLTLKLSSICFAWVSFLEFHDWCCLLNLFVQKCLLVTEQWAYTICFRTLTISIPRATRQNGSLYLHLFTLPRPEHQPDAHNWDFWKLRQDPVTVYTRIKLTQYHVPEATTFRLLGGGSNKLKKVCDIPIDMYRTAEHDYEEL